MHVAGGSDTQVQRHNAGALPSAATHSRARTTISSSATAGSGARLARPPRHRRPPAVPRLRNGNWAPDACAGAAAEASTGTQSPSKSSIAAARRCTGGDGHRSFYRPVASLRCSSAAARPARSRACLDPFFLALFFLTESLLDSSSLSGGALGEMPASRSTLQLAAPPLSNMEDRSRDMKQLDWMPTGVERVTNGGPQLDWMHGEID
ncbi:hypothetical protein ACP70R_037333 [Stipagrostis hirtigluma subsp. patula]